MSKEIINSKDLIINSINNRKEEIIRRYNHKIDDVANSNNIAETYYLLSESFGNTMEQGNIGIEFLKSNFTNEFFNNADIKNTVNYIVFSDSMYNGMFRIMFPKSLVKNIIIEFDGKKNKSYYSCGGYMDIELISSMKTFLSHKTFKNLKSLTKTYYDRLYQAIANNHYSGKVRLREYIRTYKQCNEKYLDKLIKMREEDNANIIEVDENNKIYAEQQTQVRGFINKLMETDLESFVDNEWNIKYDGKKYDNSEPVTYNGKNEDDSKVVNLMASTLNADNISTEKL